MAVLTCEAKISSHW